MICQWGLHRLVLGNSARLHFHWNRLIEDINPARPAVQQFLDAQTNRLDSLITGNPNQAAV